MSGTNLTRKASFMSDIKVEPHLRVLGSSYDPADEDEFEGWDNYLDYHINAPAADTNNMYVGSIIGSFTSYVIDNSEMFWKIEYYEVKAIPTTGGTMTLPGQRFDVTEVSTNGEHETFMDRNSDGYHELNRGIPVYEHCPRFLTEHDVDPKLIEKTADDDEAKKPKGEGAPGEEVEGEDEPDDTLHVSDGDVITVYDELGHEQQLRISVV
jgi:hypothetical protein